jgi:hypothetical protein
MSNWLCFTPKRSEQSGELYTDGCKDHVVELTAYGCTLYNIIVIILKLFSPYKRSQQAMSAKTISKRFSEPGARSNISQWKE